MESPGVNPVDRSHPLPLWAQVEADLRRRLARDAFTEHFPTDMELVQQYGVSRHTVREAVARLTDDGLLERRRGLGTVIRQPQFEQPLGSLYSLFRSIEGQGVEQRSRVLSLEEVRNEEAADRLGLGLDASLVHLRRVRYAGDEPLVLDESWLPAERARPLLDVDFTHTALYAELAGRCGVRVASGWERIRPIVPDPATCAELQIPEGQAAFAVERLAHDDDGIPVDARTSVVRGDRYGFVARWSDTARSDIPSLEALDEAV